MYGDMANRLCITERRFPEIKSHEFVVHEVEIENAIGIWARANGDRLSAQRGGEFDMPPLELDHAEGFYEENCVIRPIFNRRKLLGIRARTDAKTGHRRVHLQSLMGTLEVVDVAPAIECLLSDGKALKAAPIEDFGLQRTMKALILAIGLWMVRTAKADLDTQSDQPDCQPGQLSRLAGGSPGRAVIRIDADRQTIAPEYIDQSSLNRAGALSATGLQGEIETGMIIQHGQRMAKAFAGWKVPLEIHLPEIIGCGMLKALPRGCRRRSLEGNQLMSVQDVCHRARGKQGEPQILQASAQFAATPAGMFLPQIDNCLLEHLARQSWAGLRSSRTIRQTRPTFGFIASQPFVRRRRTDLITLAQRPTICPFLQGQQNKFFAQTHGVFYIPRHGFNTRKSNPDTVSHVSVHLLTMCAVYTAKQKKVRPPVNGGTQRIRKQTPHTKRKTRRFRKPRPPLKSRTLHLSKC